MKTRIGLLVLLATMLPAHLSAQTVVSPGERVRVYGERSWTGVVQRSMADYLILLVDRVDEPLRFSLSSLDRLEVYAGGGSRGKGLLIGAGVGGGVGLLAGAFYKGTDCGLSTRDAGSEILGDICGLTAMSYMPVVGILLGGAVGALASGGERWYPVLLPSRTASIKVRPTFGEGFGFAASIPFGQ